MTIYRLELKRGALSLILWTAAISFMLGVSILVYPEMSGQIDEIGDMFSEMGSFSAAFGMDRLNFGEFIGYFATECGNTLGLGGALFAALMGISALSKEEKENTAEFLLTHPISRDRVIFEKLCAVFTQVILLNAAAAVVTVLFSLLIDADVNAKSMALLLFAQLLMQLEIAAITFGLSAFVKRGSLGVGLGLPLVLYFLNLLSNLTEKAEFLRILTPYAYTEGAYILTEGTLRAGSVAFGMALAVVGVLTAFLRFRSKDIS